MSEMMTPREAANADLTRVEDPNQQIEIPDYTELSGDKASLADSIGERLKTLFEGGANLPQAA